jgi:hypothetical protein
MDARESSLAVKQLRCKTRPWRTVKQEGFHKAGRTVKDKLTSTVFRHFIHTLLVSIAVAVFALHALFDDSLQKLPAELAHSWAHVAMQNKRVWDSYTSSCFLVCCASTQ